MAEIKLKALLRAYSKAPFHQDYVRGVNVSDDGSIENLDPNTLYGRRNGKWEKIFEGNMAEISDRLISMSDKIDTHNSTFTEYFHNIDLSFNRTDNKLIYIDYLGQPHEYVLNVSVDNDSIRYNNKDELELKYKPDNETIKNEIVMLEDGSWKGIQKAVALKYNKHVTDSYGQSQIVEDIITGSDIIKINEQTRAELDLLQEKIDKQVDGYNGLQLDTINLADIYKAQSTISDLNAVIQSTLTSHAIKQLNVASKASLPDNIRVLDIYKGNLWIFSRTEKDTVGSWKNNGRDLVVSATNDGVIGQVTGAEWDKSGPFDDDWQNDENYLKGHILSQLINVLIDGESITQMTPPLFEINGLADRLSDLDDTKVERIDNSNNGLDVAYIQKAYTNGYNEPHNKVDTINISCTSVSNSLVSRMSDGRIKFSGSPLDYDDAININYVNQIVMNLKSGIDQLKITEYKEDLIKD